MTAFRTKLPPEKIATHSRLLRTGYWFQAREVELLPVVVDRAKIVAKTHQSRFSKLLQIHEPVPGVPVFSDVNQTLFGNKPIIGLDQLGQCLRVLIFNRRGFAGVIQNVIEMSFPIAPHALSHAQRFEVALHHVAVPE